MRFEEDFKILKNLTEIQGCSGNENKVREYIRKTVEEYCDKIETDVLGNLFCFIKGEKKTNSSKLKIMFDAHMDEIGFIVRYINENGFIKFSKVGGQNTRILPGQKVTIHSTSGKEIIGVIGEKAIHLIEKEDRKKTTDIEDLFIDVGMKSREEVKKYIAVGDYITLKQECTAFENKNRIFSKAFDDRAGCFVFIKLIKELSKLKEQLDKDLIFQFAAQEEIGVRGATVGSFKVSPDIAIVVEVVHAIDYPSVSKEKFYECDLGSGTSIRVGPNLFSKLSKLLIETAKEEELPYILKAEPRATPTDARAIQMTKSGIPCALVAIPLRYMHTNIETLEYGDLVNTVKLLKNFTLKDLKTPIKL
ncbi:MAG: M42 family metallopeptidase [Promethearchaeia archaeon]